jgi:hypothetical protein
VIEAGHAKLPAADAEGASGPDAQGARRAVANQGLFAVRAGASGDHESAGGELAGVEPEEQERAPTVHGDQVELDPRRLGHGGLAGHSLCERLWEERAGQIRDPFLEEAEVSSSDVDQGAGGVSHAGGDREERHDEPHADRHARGGHHGADQAPPQVAPDEADERHGRMGASPPLTMTRRPCHGQVVRDRWAR